MRERNYTESEKTFKEVYINKCLSGLGMMKDKFLRSRISEKYDKEYIRTDVEIENSQDATVHTIPADRFYLNAGKKFILNESGTLTWKHKFKLAVIVPIIQSCIKIRQIKKKAKVKAAAIGDNIHLGRLSNEEYGLKIVING